MHQKLVRDPFLILVNSPKHPLHARNSFKIRYIERGLSKSHKNVGFFSLFRTQCLLIGQDYKLQKGVAKQVQKNSFISDVLPDQVR